MQGRPAGEKPLNSNPASERPAGGAGVAPLSAEGSRPEAVRRFSPLASLIVLTLLSLGTWAAIWAAIASLVPG
jgi:hypothetical protein